MFEWLEGQLPISIRGQVKSGQIKSDLVKSEKVKSEVKTGQVRTGQVGIGQVGTGPVRTGQLRNVASSQDMSSQVLTDQVKTNQIQNFLRPKTFWDPTLFRSIFFYLKSFGPKILLDIIYILLAPKIFGPNIF